MVVSFETLLINEEGEYSQNSLANKHELTTV